MTEDVAIPSAALRIHLDAPSWEGRRTAAIGALRFEEVGPAIDLLQCVADDLADRGYGAIVGPMDGDTWHAYRAVVRSDGSAPFLMEPRSGPHDVDALRAAGFGIISRYVSSRASPSTAASPLPDSDVSVTPWDGTGAERLLAHLFEMSSAAFAKNPFYKPIAADAFLAMYAPIIPRLDRNMVLFARDLAGDLVGFLFGTPDLLQGERPTRAILKTYASRRRGIGRLLAEHFHRVAAERGFTEVIHALMHADNPSLVRSGLHGGEVFREYALMGRTLRP